jgi:hypothetical protein
LEAIQKDATDLREDLLQAQAILAFDLVAHLAQAAQHAGVEVEDGRQGCIVSA